MSALSHPQSLALDVRESAAPLDEGVLAVVLQAHRREGYDAGYRRALTDVLAASVFVAEKSLRDAGDASTRQVLYRFIESLERETLRFKRDEVFSEGGGI